MRGAAAPTTVDAYIAASPPKVRRLLAQLRGVIRAAAPRAEEKIAYRMPAYVLNGALVYFAGYEKYIGFYPGGVVAEFAKYLEGYTTSKGTIHLPLDRPLPVALVRKIVKARVAQNLARAASRGKR
jgi:uncharacterized protein YdhG (YjbR/CyaY superfamily)